MKSWFLEVPDRTERGHGLLRDEIKQIHCGRKTACLWSTKLGVPPSQCYNQILLVEY